ncbi:MAG: hypothetical protein PVSMB9_05520 [Candidatus Dormibacteria bacterium]
MRATAATTRISTIGKIHQRRRINDPKLRWRGAEADIKIYSQRPAAQISPAGALQSMPPVIGVVETARG